MGNSIKKYNNIRVENIRELPEDDFKEVAEETYFSKAPRTYYLLNSDPIELDAPPEKHVDERQPVIMTIGPAFTMALPMIMGFFITRVASKNNESSAFMYTGIVTAICSALLGVTWAMANIKNRRKQLLISEAKRKAAYTRYVRKSEAIIKEQYNRNAGNLRLTYPDVYEYVSDKVNKFLLWNRNFSDEDYLCVRIGTGNVPCDIKINIPKDRFSVVEDELKNLPKRLKSKYSQLKDVPQVIDLGVARCIGIICDNIRIREELFFEILTIIAVNISPEELAFKLIFRKNIISSEAIDAVRFTPHLFGTSDARTLVVFTDSYEFANGSDLGGFDNYIYVVIADRYEVLPSECRVIIQRDSQFSGYMNLSKDKLVRHSVHFDTVDKDHAEEITRKLCSIKHRTKVEEYTIPDKVSFYDIWEHIIQSDEIINNWEVSNTEYEINAPIGISERGEILVMNFHEKGAGPHGLIAGTTGSGKSEILQTIVLSLAVNYSPEDVGFFLIDYKGGGMAGLFECIPHVMGSISNLSGRMIYRAMASVKSENTRRQRIFIEARVNNISEYQLCYKRGEVEHPLPHIFIIIDEFAELKKEEPEFMKELISVARVGRSLGVHLILATQKPAGTVDDNILSNSRFRICLRVQDRSDSMEMLRKPDAANIKNPGRAILQIGNDEEYVMFQSAYTMDKSLLVTKAKTIKITDKRGNLYEKKIRAGDVEEGITQLERVITEIKNASEVCKYKRGSPLWLEPLKETIYYSLSNQNRNFGNNSFHNTHNRFDIGIGIYDDPTNQIQGELCVNLIDNGHLIVLGGLQSGKSTLLATISLAFLENTKRDFINIFYLDFSQELLKPFSESVVCGGYINEENEEDIEKLFILLRKISLERKERLKGGNYRQYTGDDIPAVILFIDGLGTFRDHTGGAFDKDIENLLKTGEALGIYVVASALNISTSEIPRRMFDKFKVCLPIQLRDKYEYREALSIQGGEFIMPEAVRGRGLVKIEDKAYEFQAYQTVEACSDFERIHVLNEVIETINKDIMNKYEIEKDVYHIPLIPKPLDYEAFVNELENRSGKTNENIPIGFFTKSGELFYLPYEKNRVVLISGRAGSGKSNLLKVIEKWARDLGTIDDSEDKAENSTEMVRFANGMEVYAYDDKLPFNILADIKVLAGDDPYVIHMGGALDRQNLADFSYIPYSEQTKHLGAGYGTVRKTMRQEEYGNIVIPKFTI